MNKSSLLLAVCATFACGFSVKAMAQSTSETVVPDGVITGSVEAAQPSKPLPIGISYLGVFNGPGFSSEMEGKTKDGDDLYMHNRPTFKYKASENILLGLQPRFNIRFMSTGMDAVLENWRLQAEFKNLIKTDVFALGITPRVSLPTSLKAHNQSMIPSPELLGKLDFAPKNSRFQFDAWYIVGNYLFSDRDQSLNAVTLDSTLATEASYQLTSDLGLTFGYYMEHASKRQSAITSASNEIDLGLNWDFAKGWSVNPVVAAECNGLGAEGSSLAKNMGVYVWVSGTVL